MKKFQTLLFILALAAIGSKVLAQGSLENRIKLQQPYSTSAQEKDYKFYNSPESPDDIDKSLINGSLGAMSNMLNGLNNNIYNAQELQKQQAEYAKQQRNNDGD